MLQQALQLVDSFLPGALKQFWNRHAADIDAMDPWAKTLRAMLVEYTLRSGKGMRPLLVAAGASLALEQPVEAVVSDPRVARLMIAIELIHKHFLMADDVFDRDELRHGKPSFHLVMEEVLRSAPSFARLSAGERTHFARSFTEWAGIWLQAMATAQLLDSGVFPPTVMSRLADALRRHIYDYTVAGELLLADQAKQALDDTVSEEQLLKGLEYVTGHYSVVGPLLVGASLDERTLPWIESLQEYGKALGTLFQITDDLIGLYGDPEVTGKPVGNDIREGKKTLMMQYAFRHGDAEQRGELARLVGSTSLTPAEVLSVQRLTRELGGEKYARQRAAEYAAAARAALITLPEVSTKSLLLELVDFIERREK